MSTFVDIDFDVDEKKIDEKPVEEKPVDEKPNIPVEEKPLENPVEEKQMLANRKNKNKTDEKKIATNIIDIVKGLTDFIDLLLTFVNEDYMFKTDGKACIDFIKNYSTMENINNFFLQNINTFNDFIKYIGLNVTTSEDKSKILNIKQSLENIINEKIKLKEEEDQYQDWDKSGNESGNESDRLPLPSPPPNRRIRIDRQGSFVNFTEHPRILPRILPKSVSNVKGEENLRVTMKDITIILDEIYNSEESQQSTTLDILAIYLKGQKILYIEAKTHCEQHLNSLMLPAIFISSLCTLLSVVLKDFNFGPILVSSLMAINSFILAMISYLKLDAKAEAHKITAYKFEKLQSLCELRSGRTLFMKNENGEKSLVDFINKLDEQVKEIKESNQFILPERIRYHYPLLYSTNVFSDIKKIYNEEMIQRTRLKNLINRIKDEPQNFKLQTDRDRLLEQIIKCRDKYLQIDDIFNKEIGKQIIASKGQISCCNWLKT
jgi:hypothetical protein